MMIEMDSRLATEVEEQLRDELALHNWWSTTGRRLAWNEWKKDEYLDKYVPTDMGEIEHRARLRLLIRLLKAARR